MRHDKDVIEFELNEKLYLKSGQEINEMVSVSLEPDISVQKHDNYIQIRGIIMLQGEYRRVDESGMRETTEDSNVNYMESVVEAGDKLTRFSHRFPVEISIPADRVDDLQDITVNVDYFDYELPDDHQFKLSASVHIKGIKPEKEQEYSNEERAVASEGGETLKREEEALEEEEKAQDEKGVEEYETKQIVENVDEMLTSEEDDKELVIDHSEEIEQSNESEHSKGEQSEEVSKTVDMDSVVEEKEQAENSEQAEETEPALLEDEEEKSRNINEIDIQLSESEADEDNEKVKDVQFLTDLFGGEEEEVQSKMRIYITQEEDTIESIAKRYEMSTLQLIKDNNLSGTELEEGQLLHIPVKAKE